MEKGKSVSLDELILESRVVPVVIAMPAGSLEFTVTYNPAIRTARFEKEIYAKAQTATEVYIETLLGLGTGWTLKRKKSDTDPIPFVREEIEGVVTLVLKATAQAIYEDESAKK